MAVTRPAQIRRRLNRNDDNKKRIIWIVVMILLGFEIPEIPTYIYYLDNEIIVRQRDWFLWPWHHQKIAEYWYYKETANHISRLLFLTAATKTAVQYSTVVFLAFFMAMMYPVIDLIMFWLNYNQWPVVYEFIILIFYLAGRGLIKPYKPDSFARIRSIF